MWIKPSGYVASAVLAGAISAVGLAGAASAALPLLALWVVLDLCTGTLSRGMRLLARSQRSPKGHRRRWGHVSTIVFSLVAGVGLIYLMPQVVGWLVGVALLLGALMALVTFRSPATLTSALVLGIQVVAAWAAAYLLTGGVAHPVLWLGALAGAGTSARLFHGLDRRLWSLWLARLCWAGLMGAVIIARQPLLAGLVAITACGDDLYRRQPVRRGDAGPLASVGWAGIWLLVSVASTYWSDLA
ncbi:MAG: hypothetical protein R6X16_05640 [Anaerolineae bacterium]